jgi:hypothetical protein
MGAGAGYLRSTTSILCDCADFPQFLGKSRRGGHWLATDRPAVYCIFLKFPGTDRAAPSLWLGDEVSDQY